MRPITKTRKTAVYWVVTSQRDDGPLPCGPMGDGLMAPHSLRGPGPEPLERAVRWHGHPEMVALATQPVQRQSGKYDASDLEEPLRNATRAMIEAKLKDEGIDLSALEEPARTDVVDLMAALKMSRVPPAVSGTPD